MGVLVLGLSFHSLLRSSRISSSKKVTSGPCRLEHIKTPDCDDDAAKGRDEAKGGPYRDHATIGLALNIIASRHFSELDPDILVAEIEA
jgi:hypothetical protein